MFTKTILFFIFKFIWNKKINSSKILHGSVFFNVHPYTGSAVYDKLMFCKNIIN